MSEQFGNGGLTTLNGSVAFDAASLVVNSTATFPTQASFRILIEDEILRVTGIAGTTFNVERGQEGTLAHSHPSGAEVRHILTAGALSQLRNEIFTPGGDLGGSGTSQTVQGIQGRAVDTTAPEDGQSLVWSEADGLWVPRFPVASWVPLTGLFATQAADAGTLTLTTDLRGLIRVGDPIRVLQTVGGYVDGLGSSLSTILTGVSLTGVQPTHLDSRGCLYVKTVNNEDGSGHAEIYSHFSCAPQTLLGHTNAVALSGIVVGTVTEDNASGLGGTLTFSWPVGPIFDTVSVSFFRWYTVETITDTAMTLFGPALNTSAGVTAQVWLGPRSNVSQVTLLVPGQFALVEDSVLLWNFLKASVPWGLPEAHITRVRARVRTAGTTAHPVINLSTLNPVLSVGLTVDGNGQWFSSGATILPKTAHLVPDQELEVSTTQGDTEGTVDSDLSLSLTVVLE